MAPKPARYNASGQKNVKRKKKSTYHKQHGKKKKKEHRGFMFPQENRK